MNKSELLTRNGDGDLQWKRLALVHIIYSDPNADSNNQHIENLLKETLGPDWTIVTLTALAEGEIHLTQDHEKS